MTYPLFVYVEFEPTDAPKTPLTPVEGVDLAYNKGGSLEWTRFTTKGGCSCHQMWSGVAEYINEFTKQLPDYAIVGWNLRNLDWPAIVFNVLAQNVKLDKKLLLPPTQKWNNLPLVDLRNLVLQGGFTEEKFTLRDAFTAMFPDEGLVSAVAMTKMLYDRYVGAL
jgi:hypothetical protein